MKYLSTENSFWLCLILAIATALVAVSGESFWIDEVQSAVLASASTWSEFVQRFTTNRGSDLQMPLYMVSLWLWEKGFGSTEFGLRALNIPFFVGALASAWVWLRSPGIVKIAFTLLACGSPFLWSYLNEARSYALQFLGATLILAGMANLIRYPSVAKIDTDSSLCMFGIVILCSASLLGVVYSAIWAVLIILILWRQKALWRPFESRGFQINFVVCSLALVAISIFYGWTLYVGAGASASAQTTVASFFFVLYEFFGFSGLGPGRLDLREGGAAALRPFVLGLGIYGLMYAALLTTTYSQRHGRDRLRFEEAGLILACLLCAIAVLSLGVVAHFRVLGRHLMPLAPFFLYALAEVIARLWNSTLAARSIVVLFVLMSFVSALSLRMKPLHAKDDYRTAAQMARDANTEGKVVWWSANAEAADFYKLTSGIERKQIFITNNMLAMDLSQMPSPDLVIFSKPDLYDRKGALQDWLKGNNYRPVNQLPAFTILSR